MVLVSCEVGIVPLGCSTATSSVGYRAFQCAPGLNRRYQRHLHLKVENVIVRMRPNSSGVSCSSENEDDPGTSRICDARPSTRQTREGLKWGGGGVAGGRYSRLGGQGALVGETSESSSTEGEAAHYRRHCHEPRRVTAAVVSDEDDVTLLGSVRDRGSVFHEGDLKRRHQQQQQQQQQENVATAVGASGERGAAEGLWRGRGRENRCPPSATVGCDDGVAASLGVRWNWPLRFFGPLYRDAGQQQRRERGLLSQAFGYNRIGRMSSSSGGRRYGTAMLMSRSTGGGIGGGDGCEKPSHPLKETAEDGGKGNAGLGGDDALSAGVVGDDGSASFAIEPEEEHARPWPLEGPSLTAAKDNSQVRRGPMKAEDCREEGGNSDQTVEAFPSLPKLHGLTQAEATDFPAAKEQAVKSRSNSGSSGGVFLMEAGAEIEVGAGQVGDLIEADASPVAESYERGRWLLGLLVLQSTSSSVLDKYQDLLREHVVVTLFLTMLVGAGGNAGNQSAIKVIRGLATGRFTADAECALRIVGGQAIVGLLLGTALAAGGFIRVLVTDGTTLRDASAISMSLFLIVMVSVLLGSALPFGFARAGVDPAHAGTTIQVAMDIVGVGVTCVTCSLVLTQLDQALSLPL